MSRVIKFKAYAQKPDGKYGCWHGGFSVHATGKVIVDESAPWLNGCEIVQFTGLCDRNGREIYEFDYLRHWDDGHIFMVEWDSGRGEWCGYGTFSEWSGCEIVGDKFTTPDLLEAGK